MVWSALAYRYEITVSAGLALYTEELSLLTKYLKPLIIYVQPSWRPAVVSTVLAAPVYLQDAGMARAVDSHESLQLKALYGRVPVRAAHTRHNFCTEPVKMIVCVIFVSL